MSLSVANRQPVTNSPALAAGRTQSSPDAGARAGAFVRGAAATRVDGPTDEAGRSLGSAARYLGEKCRSHQEMLARGHAPRPEYLGSVNTDHLKRRVGASLETFVYRNPATGDIALVDVTRPGPRPGGVPAPIAQRSSLLVKADGRVFDHGREVTRGSREFRHASERIDQIGKAVARNSLDRLPQDVQVDVRLPWSPSN